MQRAVACAALASGESVLRSPSLCADGRAALAVAEALGAEVSIGTDRVGIRGIGLGRGPAGRSAPSAAPRILSCGESGLSLRMFTPIAALFPGESILEAKGSLLSRPVTAIEAPLEGLGAGASTKGGFPPVRVRGPMRGGSIEVDAGASSQFLTGLLIALPLAPRDSVLSVPRIVSSGYVELTLRTMAAFGVAVGTAPGFSRFDIAGGRSYASRDFAVEGDWSGAAFLLVAGAIAGPEGGLLSVEGLSLGSEQPDRAILDALERSGARVETETVPGGALSIHVMRSSLRSFDFDATGCPDLFPPLAVLAACCAGVTTIRGATRLKAKESDRATALREELGKLGVEIEVEGDLMRVHGNPGRGAGGRVRDVPAGAGAPLRIDPRGDHRMAMAAAVLALAGGSSVEIEGAECVSKSWPSFFEDLEALKG
jgi:3-phosphoshikimate 1-carboxyvinyltransferase